MVTSIAMLVYQINLNGYKYCYVIVTNQFKRLQVLLCYGNKSISMITSIAMLL